MKGTKISKTVRHYLLLLVKATLGKRRWFSIIVMQKITQNEYFLERK